MTLEEKLIFEQSREGLFGVVVPRNSFSDDKKENPIPEKFLRKSDSALPELSQPDIVRHYTRLSKMTLGVDSTFYPLGSCTMKYNPKINESLASLEGFLSIHPLQDESTVQGMLQIMYELSEWLKALTGLHGCSLQPSAGAHGEQTSLLVLKKYFNQLGDSKRKYILIPDTAHGTNPASAIRSGFVTKQISSNSKGLIDIEKLNAEANDETAALMLTNPNTLGLFEEEIIKITELIHSRGGQVYLDGANFNAIIGITKPGDFGIDIMHLNLHKTFSTPHGGGGPGAGPIAVKKHLEPFLPVPRIIKENDTYYLSDVFPQSIGKVRSFYGNLAVAVRAYVYLLSMGREGIPKIAKHAVLNANYLLSKVKEILEVPFGDKCMHEFVASAKNINKQTGVKALDIAKAIIDRNFHPPTVYFPLIVPEAIMIEPTETENKATLDEFAGILKELVALAQTQPELLKNAPVTTPISRPDELTAARNPILQYKKNN